MDTKHLLIYVLKFHVIDGRRKSTDERLRDGCFRRRPPRPRCVPVSIDPWRCGPSRVEESRVAAVVAIVRDMKEVPTLLVWSGDATQCKKQIWIEE